MAPLPLTDSPLNFGPSFVFSIIFGLIGTVYFMYGKRQQKYVPMFVGIGLGVYPYFITNVVAVVAIGVILMAAPFLMTE